MPAHPRVDCLLRRPPGAATAGMVELFPVQGAVWNLTAGGNSRRHDVCIRAPTGSGKTLAYLIPLTQSLSGCAAWSILRGKGAGACPPLHLPVGHADAPRLPVRPGTWSGGCGG